MWSDAVIQVDLAANDKNLLCQSLLGSSGLIS